MSRFFHDRGKYIRFHRENSPKTCPGIGIDKAQVMSEVKALGTTQPKKVATIIDKKEEPEMKKADAEKVIAYLQAAWKASTSLDEKKEIGRLADELRVAGGMKKVNS